mmetsp:Transcript_32271/g.75887  ORF Transcript_32271/g.75887 Transcript_32271/m.75887 type:complete len:86 (-) Transcript_32271:89-346(-)
MFHTSACPRHFCAAAAAAVSFHTRPLLALSIVLSLSLSLSLSLLSCNTGFSEFRRVVSIDREMECSVTTLYFVENGYFFYLDGVL